VRIQSVSLQVALITLEKNLRPGSSSSGIGIGASQPASWLDGSSFSAKVIYHPQKFLGNESVEFVCHVFHSFFSESMRAA